MSITDKKYFSYQITQRFIKAMDKIIGTGNHGEKVTARSFGEVVGISSSNLNRLRSSTGENVVTVEAIGRLCDNYKISPFWLILNVGEMENDGSIKLIERRIKRLEAAIKKIQDNMNTSQKGKINKTRKPK